MSNVDQFNNWDYDYICKILVVGDAGTGKSSLLVRHVDDDFSNDHLATIGVDFKLRTIQHKDKTVKVQFWDTAGQERFRSITTGYYRGSNGIIVVYDITNERSFLNVEQWLEQIREYAADNVKIMLVGNKMDLKLRRAVDRSRGEELSKNLGISFMETSAKESTNVHEAFDQIVRDIINAQSYMINNNKFTEKIVKPVEQAKTSTSCCGI
jgi:small GTP-binding protein